MDPYLERSEIWPDFHDRLTTFLCGILQPLLRPRYVVLTQDRLYVVEADRPIRPDVSVVRASSPASGGGTTAVLETDAPAVFALWREEIRQPLVHIVEPAAGNRLVTAIEVLSPDNKRSGPGRVSYFQKREELWDGGANLVEIDLWRAGEAKRPFDAQAQLLSQQRLPFGERHGLAIGEGQRRDFAVAGIILKRPGNDLHAQPPQLAGADTAT
jgi:hypothetical protein